MDALAVVYAVGVLVDECLALLICVAILLHLVLVGAEVERWSGYVEVSFLDDAWHEAVEKRHDKGVDVRAIDVGIGHDDDLVVAQLVDVSFLVVLAIDAETHADALDDVHHRLRFEHLVPHHFLYIENLSAQRKDGLGVAVASLLG